MPGIKVRQNAAAGLLFCSIGLIGIVLSLRLPVGTAMHMGPGFMPLALSFLLCGLGAIIGMRSLASPGGAFPGWHARPLLAVIGAVLLFAVSINRLGLILAVVATVALCAVAAPESRKGETAALAACLAVFCAALFKLLLGLPISLWPAI
jgi:putative tricarboxylic transport membrane protein